MLQPRLRARAVLLYPFRGPIACADDYNTTTTEYERDASILDIKTVLKKEVRGKDGTSTCVTPHGPGPVSTPSPTVPWGHSCLRGGGVEGCNIFNKYQCYFNYW